MTHKGASITCSQLAVALRAEVASEALPLLGRNRQLLFYVIAPPIIKWKVFQDFLHPKTGDRNEEWTTGDRLNIFNWRFYIRRQNVNRGCVYLLTSFPISVFFKYCEYSPASFSTMAQHPNFNIIINKRASTDTKTTSNCHSCCHYQLEIIVP